MQDLRQESNLNWWPTQQRRPPTPWKLWSFILKNLLSNGWLKTPLMAWVSSLHQSRFWYTYLTSVYLIYYPTSWAYYSTALTNQTNQCTKSASQKIYSKTVLHQCSKLQADQILLATILDRCYFSIALHFSCILKPFVFCWKLYPS